MSRTWRGWAALLLGVVSIAASSDLNAVADTAAASPFARCEGQAGEKWTYDDFMCVYGIGRQHNLLPEVRRRLRRLGAGDVEHPWATLVLAHATFEQDETQGISLYELA